MFWETRTLLWTKRSSGPRWVALAVARFVYTYDYRNRLIEVESKTTGSYSTVLEYEYDGLNRRVKKEKSGLENVSLPKTSSGPGRATKGSVSGSG